MRRLHVHIPPLSPLSQGELGAFPLQVKARATAVDRAFDLVPSKIPGGDLENTVEVTPGAEFRTEIKTLPFR